MKAIPFVGRRAESAEIDKLIELIPHGSGRLLFEGEAGIGKTTLLNWARVQALGSGFQVLSASPVEAEVPLEFVGLADLLRDVPTPYFDQLPLAQRSALDSAVFRETIPERPVDPHTLASAVLAVLVGLARTTPLLLAIDDLPWLDVPTARVLSFVLRRAGAARLGFVATARTEWPAAPESLANSLFASIPMVSVRVGPLEPGEIHDLLASRLSLPPSRAKMAQIHRISQGNPYFALEMAGTQYTVTVEGEIATVPLSLSRLVLERLQTLPASGRDVLLICALTPTPTVQAVRAAAMNPMTANDDLDFAERVGILHRHDEIVKLSHPLIHSVVIADATSRQRRSAHTRLARIVEDQEQRARHLAFATNNPEENTAQEVEKAANVAGSRGASDTAALLARLSVRLTPPERISELHRRTALEAEFCFLIGETARACDLLEKVVGHMPPGPPRAEMLRRLARYLTHRGGLISTWATTLGMALEESAEDRSLRASILVDAMFATTYTDDLAAPDAYLDLAVTAVEELHDEVLAAQLNAALARISLVRGEGLRRDLIDRALQGPDLPARLAVEMRPNVVIGHVLRLIGDLNGARELYLKEDRRVRQEGVEIGLPLILGGLVQTESSAGNWERAESLGIEASERAEDSGSIVAQSYVASATALLRVYQGRIEDGRSDAHRSIRLARIIGMPVFLHYAAEALGLAELSIGDAAAAHRCLDPFVGLARLRGFREPSLLRYIPDDVEALIRLGDLQTADELLTAFEARATELERSSEMVASIRCRGLLLAANGRFDEAEATLAAGLEQQEGLAKPFESGRTLLVAGEIHRRARHKALAKTNLCSALEIFRRLGAPLWADRSRSELDRLGLRHVTEDSDLTTTERRVADLVAIGLTNAQVAAQLFMSSRTVEAHLSRVYRKLDVHSRTAMSRVLTARETMANVLDGE
jgi:DNA-binding CsgD family transcriptional regulator